VFSLVLTIYVVAFLMLGVRRPFLWVLAYLYIDIVAPQKVVWAILPHMQISLVAFLAACAGWLFVDRKQNSRFTLRQALLLLLLLYCGISTMSADFPVEAAEKWAWVWKALVFAIFLPLTLHTRLRIEAAVLVMSLSIGAIVISGGIKTVAGGGGYGMLKLLVNDNTGLYEGSIISCVAISAIPLIAWLAKHGTIFPSDWRVKLFAAALCFACALMPVGTAARTGLLCLGVLAVLSLRSVKRRFLYLGLMGALGLAAVPFLPRSFTDRMSTIDSHKADESASTRVAVWNWTLEYVEDHPFGGGFDAYRQNRLSYRTATAKTDGATTTIEYAKVEDKARAYHSSYFEMLGEQGWPGLFAWLWLQLLGLWQMERIRMRWKKRTGEGETWQAPLATALQHAQIVYLVGSLFVGIAFQPFILMLIGVQCGLWSYLKRVDPPAYLPFARRHAAARANAVAAGQGALPAAR
jgi:probable O-glycosylation ligase (exosortase A-associated)